MAHLRRLLWAVAVAGLPCSAPSRATPVDRPTAALVTAAGSPWLEVAGDRGEAAPAEAVSDRGDQTVDLGPSATVGRLGVGGGLVVGAANADRGEVNDYAGFYATLNVISKRGILGRVSISFGDFEASGETGGIDQGLLRLDVTGGFLFRRRRRLRPFLYGGVSMMSVSENGAGSGPIVEDATIGLTAGGGVEVGGKKHAFYLDVSYDPGRSLDTFAGSFDFDLSEAHAGYLYRFAIDQDRTASATGRLRR